MLHDEGEAKAVQAYAAAATYKIDFDDTDVREAMNLRLHFRTTRKLKLSYADALGYHLSLKHKIKFLTGDREFEELENVEYVK